MTSSTKGRLFQMITERYRQLNIARAAEKNPLYTWETRRRAAKEVERWKVEIDVLKIALKEEVLEI